MQPPNPAALHSPAARASLQRMSLNLSQPLLIDEDARRRVEGAWLQGKPLAIGQCLPARDDAGYLATLAELVHLERELAWRRPGLASRQGSTVGPEALLVDGYLLRFPEL